MLKAAIVHTFANAAGGGESSGTGTGGLGAAGATVPMAPFASDGTIRGTAVACALSVQRLVCHIRLLPDNV